MRVLWMSYLLFELAACGPVLNFGPNQAVPPGNYQAVPPGNYQAVPPGNYQAVPPGNYQAVPPGNYQAVPPGNYQAVPPGNYQAVPYQTGPQYAVPSPEGSSQGLYWWSAPVSPESAHATNHLPQQETFFSDVSGLDPVYSVNARSRYQTGRSVFARSRYVPGKPQSGPQPLPFPFFLLPVPNPAPQPQDFSQSAPQPAAPYPGYTPLQWGFPGSVEKAQQ